MSKEEDRFLRQSRTLPEAVVVRKVVSDDTRDKEGGLVKSDASGRH